MASSSSPDRSSTRGCRSGVAGFPGNRKPLRRAARHDGFFPANIEHPDQLAEVVATITHLRQYPAAPYDFAVAPPPGADPAPYSKAGATSWMAEFAPDTVTLDQVRGVLRDGPPAGPSHAFQASRVMIRPVTAVRWTPTSDRPDRTRHRRRGRIG
jgi:hypothetical protein